MNTYTATVTLKVQVDAYGQSEAEDMLYDTFGPGEDCGVTITDFKSTSLEPVK